MVAKYLSVEEASKNKQCICTGWSVTCVRRLRRLTRVVSKTSSLLLREPSGPDINKDIHGNDDEPAVRGKADLQRLRLYHSDSPRGEHTTSTPVPCARVKLESH